MMRKNVDAIRPAAKPKLWGSVVHRPHLAEQVVQPRAWGEFHSQHHDCDWNDKKIAHLTAPEALSRVIKQHLYGTRPVSEIEAFVLRLRRDGVRQTWLTIRTEVSCAMVLL